MHFISQNKEWLFSGLLVAVPLALISWLLSKRKAPDSQIQESGKNSLNIQAKENIHIEGGVNNDRSNSKSR